ncbi:hypothetical protein [Streptomyces sp. NPDC058964]|uniref:hypothetical protein n=1 Tax=Streptomyces sp. NPDC058964 TaxID=3346681 RepID=UPI0036B1D011
MNGPAARWAGAAEGGTVFSAAEVWPLPAFPADGAEGTARAWPAKALGVPAGQAARVVRELPASVDVMPGLHSALGPGTDRAPEPREEWGAGLPPESHGVLTHDLVAALQALDAWAARRTGGPIERMPLELTAPPPTPAPRARPGRPRRP